MGKIKVRLYLETNKSGGILKYGDREIGDYVWDYQLDDVVRDYKNDKNINFRIIRS